MRIKSPFIAADVSKEAEVEAMVSTVSNTLGGLDVMVANAGIFKGKPVIESTAEEWDQTFAVNTRGIFLAYKYAARQMIHQNRGGRIIGCSSVAGRKSGAGTSAYGASKFAVRGLTQSAALELGEHGITVNAYAPGFVKTAMTEGFWEDASPLLNLWGISLPPFFKVGEPEDIASLVAYLASKEAHYITGQTISVNGGVLFD